MNAQHISSALLFRVDGFEDALFWRIYIAILFGSMMSSLKEKGAVLCWAPTCWERRGRF